MKISIISYFLCLLLVSISFFEIHSQSHTELEGGIRIGNADLPAPGTMRWTGSDFEGSDGSNWKSFTQSESSEDNCEKILIDTLPFSINESGYYYLDRQLRFNSNGGLQINAPAVIVDFNGFAIDGSDTPKGIGNAISILSNVEYVNILKGIIRWWPNNGIYIGNSDGTIIIKDFKIRNCEGDAVSISGSDNNFRLVDVNLKNVKISSCEDGVFASKKGRVIVDNCEIALCESALNLNDMHSKITNSLIQENEHGIILENRFLIDNCVFYDNEKSAIRTINTDGSILNCRIDGNDQGDDFFDAPVNCSGDDNYVIVKNNTLSNNSNDLGIRFQTNGHLESNTIYGTEGTAFYFTNNNVTWTLNRAYDNTINVGGPGTPVYSLNNWLW